MDYNHICIFCMREKKGNEPICIGCGSDERSYVRPEEALAPRTILNGRYMVGAVISKGYAGFSYAAIDLISQRRIDIYQWKRMGSGSPEAFVKEQGFQPKKKGLPGIGQVFDTFTEQGKLFAAVEHLPDEILRDYLSVTTGSYSWEQASDLFMPMMESVHYLNEEGCAYGNISPETVRIRRLPNGKLSARLVPFTGFDGEEASEKTARADISGLAVCFTKSVMGLGFTKDPSKKSAWKAAGLTAQQGQVLQQGLIAQSGEGFESVGTFAREILANASGSGMVSGIRRKKSHKGLWITLLLLACLAGAAVWAWKAGYLKELENWIRHGTGTEQTAGTQSGQINGNGQAVGTSASDEESSEKQGQDGTGLADADEEISEAGGTAVVDAGGNLEDLTEADGTAVVDADEDTEDLTEADGTVVVDAEEDMEELTEADGTAVVDAAVSSEDLTEADEAGIADADDAGITDADEEDLTEADDGLITDPDAEADQTQGDDAAIADEEEDTTEADDADTVGSDEEGTTEADDAAAEGADDEELTEAEDALNANIDEAEEATEEITEDVWAEDEAEEESETPDPDAPRFDPALPWVKNAAAFNELAEQIILGNTDREPFAGDEDARSAFERSHAAVSSVSGLNTYVQCDEQSGEYHVFAVYEQGIQGIDQKLPVCEDLSAYPWADFGDLTAQGEQITSEEYLAAEQANETAMEEVIAQNEALAAYVKYLNGEVTQTNAVATGNALNVRNAPKSGDVIGQLTKGDKVIVITAVADGWMMIDYKGKPAYAAGSYIEMQ